ncbi:helix-turn-helix domain-containing protein [Cytobacillus sp. Hm23]
MERIQCKLSEALSELNISGYKLSIEAKLRPSTIQDLVHNRMKSVKITTLLSIISTLNAIAKEKGLDKEYNVSDIFIYIKM